MHHARRRSRALVALVASAVLAAALPLAGGVRAASGSPAAPGYWLVASDGGIFAFGDAPFHGSTGAITLNQPIVGMAPTPASPGTPGGAGYWLVASDGGIFAFGDAPFHGSTGAITLNQPIVGMAPTPTGAGYWLVAADGGIFAFGDAAFHGSTGNLKLNRPIAGMAPTPTGAGYWLVAADGGIFAFGDARFYGSAPERGIAGPVVATRPTPTGRGYWQALASGQVLAFGDAADFGSTGPLNRPVVAMAATPTGAGYWLVAADGGIFAFGDAGFFGSTGGIQLNQPIVGLAPLGAAQPAQPAPAANPSSPATTSPPATTPAVPPTQPPTSPPAPYHHPADPDGLPPEPIAESMESPYGGYTTGEVPATPNDCGFPELARRTVLPEDIDYIGEASGMALSRRHPGVYWVIRDSGHTAAVNAVRIDAQGMATSREIMVPGALNGDWEEVSYNIGADGRGRLWVVDNGGSIKNRKIYEILEPDPDTAETAEILGEYRWEYPGSSHTTEASFMARGYLVIVTKTSPHAKLYRFETLDPDRTNQPTYIGELGNSKSVSVVRQSPDGQLLVTASHEVVNLYRSTDGSGSLKSFGGRLPDCQITAFPGEHVEAGEFSGEREMEFIDEVKKTFRLRLAP